MLKYFIELIVLPLFIGVSVELISEWLIRKWHDKGDKWFSLSALSKHKKAPRAGTLGVFFMLSFIELLSGIIIPFRGYGVNL